MRLASLSKPAEAMPTKAWPSDLAEIRGEGLGPWAITAQAASGSAGIPSTRARSLPRPPGSTPRSESGTCAQHVGERADHAVAAERNHGFAGAGRLPGELARVGEIARVAAAHLQAVTARVRPHIGREPPPHARRRRRG